MKIYITYSSFDGPVAFYVLTSDDGRLIANNQSDIANETCYHRSIADLLRAYKKLNLRQTNNNIKSHHAKYEEIVSFSSLWKFEEQFPELLL